MTTDTALIRAELRDLVASRAFRYGDFVLTSGRRSDFYVDGKQVTLHGRGLQLIALLALAQCRELGVDAVGGLTLGADPIAAAIAAFAAAAGTPLTAFIIRKETKAHGTGGAIEGPPLRSGMRVLLVDDTLTTGGTFLQARDALAGSGVIIAGALCVVDREEGGREALEHAGIAVHSLFLRSEFPSPHAAVSQAPART